MNQRKIDQLVRYVQIEFERAIKRGDCDEALRLFKNNPSINPSKRSGYHYSERPFVAAARYGHVELFIALMQRRRDLHILPATQQCHESYEIGNDDMMRAVAEKNRISIMKEIISRQFIQIRADEWCYVQIASKHGHAKMVRLLLQHITDGTHPLNYSLIYAAESDHIEVVDILFEHQFGICKEKFLRAIKQAGEHRRFYMIQRLFEHGIDIYDDLKKIYNTTLEDAVCNRYYSIVNLLLNMPLRKRLLSLRTYKRTITNAMALYDEVMFKRLINHDITYRVTNNVKYKVICDILGRMRFHIAFRAIADEWYRRYHRDVLFDVAVGFKQLNLPVLVQLTIVEELLGGNCRHLSEIAAWNIMKLVHLEN